MSFPSVALAVILTLLGQVWVANLFYEVARWQKNQILLDNTVIQLAQVDRKLLNQVLRANEILSALEKSHHGVHFCAKVPFTMLFCRPLDKALEVSITTLIHTTTNLIATRWIANEKFARVQLVKLERTSGMRIERPVLKLHRKRCPICHLESKIVIENPRFATRLWAQSASRSLQSGYDLQLEGQKKGKTYNYFLVADVK